MAKVYDLDAYRTAVSSQEVPVTRNQELLAQIQSQLKASDTPKSRLEAELRVMEETLLANHRQYARLWEAADQLGIEPPVRTPLQIVADADGRFPEGTPPLPSSLSVHQDRLPSPGDIAEDRGELKPPPSEHGRGR